MSYFTSPGMPRGEAAALAEISCIVVTGNAKILSLRCLTLSTGRTESAMYSRLLYCTARLVSARSMWTALGESDIRWAASAAPMPCDASIADWRF